MNAALGNARIQHNLQLLCQDARFEGCCWLPGLQHAAAKSLSEFCASCALEQVITFISLLSKVSSDSSQIVSVFGTPG